MEQTTAQVESELAEVTDNPRSVSATAESAAAIETDGLFSTIDDVAGQMDVTGFKCVKCGLAHGHDTAKHQISETFAIGADDAASEMEYNPTCHCGVTEASLHGSDFGVDEAEATSIANSAPIPDEERVAMSEKYA